MRKFTKKAVGILIMLAILVTGFPTNLLQGLFETDVGVAEAAVPPGDKVGWSTNPLSTDGRSLEAYLQDVVFPNYAEAHNNYEVFSSNSEGTSNVFYIRVKQGENADPLSDADKNDDSDMFVFWISKLKRCGYSKETYSDGITRVYNPSSNRDEKKFNYSPESECGSPHATSGTGTKAWYNTFGWGLRPDPLKSSPQSNDFNVSGSTPLYVGNRNDTSGAIIWRANSSVTEHNKSYSGERYDQQATPEGGLWLYTDDEEGPVVYAIKYSAIWKEINEYNESLGNGVKGFDLKPADSTHPNPYYEIYMNGMPAKAYRGWSNTATTVDELNNVMGVFNIGSYIKQNIDRKICLEVVNSKKIIVRLVYADNAPKDKDGNERAGKVCERTGDAGKFVRTLSEVSSTNDSSNVYGYYDPYSKASKNQFKYAYYWMADAWGWISNASNASTNDLHSLKSMKEYIADVETNPSEKYSQEAIFFKGKPEGNDAYQVLLPVGTRTYIGNSDNKNNSYDGNCKQILLKYDTTKIKNYDPRYNASPDYPACVHVKSKKDEQENKFFEGGNSVALNCFYSRLLLTNIKTDSEDVKLSTNNLDEAIDAASARNNASAFFTDVPATTERGAKDALYIDILVYPVNSNHESSKKVYRYTVDDNKYDTETDVWRYDYSYSGETTPVNGVHSEPDGQCDAGGSVSYYDEYETDEDMREGQQKLKLPISGAKGVSSFIDDDGVRYMLEGWSQYHMADDTKGSGSFATDDEKDFYYGSSAWKTKLKQNGTEPSTDNNITFKLRQTTTEDTKNKLSDINLFYVVKPPVVVIVYKWVNFKNETYLSVVEGHENLLKLAEFYDTILDIVFKKKKTDHRRLIKMMFKGKKGICAALSLSLILSTAFFPKAAYASEKVTAYVVSSILYDMDIGDYSDSRAEKLSYYDSGLLRMVNSAGESVDNVGENIYSYSIREEYSYTKKNFPKKYTYSYSEALLEGDEDPIEAKWSVAFTVNDQGMVRKYRQEETGEAVKFKYENGLMVKKTNGIISTSFDYTDGVITHAKAKNTEDGSVNEINFELDQYGNVKKETGLFKHIVDGEYDTEEKVNNYKLVYRNKRLVKLKSERDLYLFKYKKIKIPAENYDMVMRQQRLILNQYSMLDDYFMFYL